MKYKLLIISLAVLLLVIGPLTAGCKSKSTQPVTTSKTTASTSVTSVVAKPEGTVTIGQPTVYEEGFLPWRGDMATMIWELVYDYLIYTKADQTFVGGLANRWETSKDATSVTLELRHGIQWQDGWGEVTTADVKYTLEQIMGKGSTNALGKTFSDAIAGIDIVDSYTMVIRLKQADPLFWLNLTDTGGPQGPILCKKYLESVTEQQAINNPIGSGPYRLVEHRFGDYLKFEALDQHWRVVPEFKYLVIKIVPEATTAIAMIKTGALDLVQIPPDQVASIQAAGLKTQLVSGGLTIYGRFGGMLIPADSKYQAGYHQMDPWKDVRVREAMNLAIDKEAIIKAFYPGNGALVSLPIILPGWQDLKPYPYNPTRARELLAAAGYANGFSFNAVSYASSQAPEIPKVFEAVCGYWENIGLKPKIVQGDKAVYGTNEATGKTAGDITLLRWTTRPDSTSSMQQYWMLESNNTYFQSTELQSMGSKLISEVDLVKRNALWKELGKYIYDNYTNIPIVLTNQVWAYSNNVAGMAKTPYGKPFNFVYIRHSTPLNTFKLFDLEK